MDIKTKMNARFKDLQGGLFLNVSKADVGEGASVFQKAGGDVMAWADMFYPDPSICRVGEDYYMVNSSFAYFPGIPVFHSRDLAHWEQIGNALDREEQLPLSGSEISRGIFAPTIRYHEGTYYIITTNVDHGGNFVITAQDPKGPWSVPHYLGDAAEGIDPSLFFDEDGKCYYVGTRPNPSGVRHNGDWEIWIEELDLHAMCLKGAGTAVWKGALKDCIWPEGPHLYKKDGWYYLMIAEGGTGPEHSISIARSRSLREWFCGCKRNPIFTHRNLGRDYPVIYAGHGDLVDDADGNWYVVMLASRPCEGHCSIGRETFLAKVEWEDGWPVINPGIGHLTEKTELPIGEYRLEKEVTHADFITFDQKKIDDRLLSLQRRDENTYSLIERKGFLRMYLKKQKLTEKTDAQYFGLRQKDYDFTFSACMEFDAERENEQAGIVCYQNHANHLSMRICGGKEKRKLQVIAHITENDTLLAEEEINAKGMLELYLKAAGQRAEFFVRDEEGKVLKLIKDVSLLPYSTEEAGGFVGCTLGVYASSNGEMSDRFADVAWISYEGISG